MSKKKNKQKTEKVIMNSDNPLFSFIKPRNNDQFMNMSGIELQELLYYIENYYLEYRNRLGFDDNVTFGLEIEVANSHNKYIQKHLKDDKIKPEWVITSDGSLHSGIEINSPILKDTCANWVNLNRVCSIIKNHCVIDETCGGHIHVGTQVLGPQKQSWLNFLKLWSVYENIIYRFVYGDYLTARSNMSKYAPPMATYFWKSYENIKKMEKFRIRTAQDYLGYHKRQAVNFLNVKDFNDFSSGNTIEFRCPNGTIEPVIWQNNVNLFINMLLYCKSSNFDNDIIDRRRAINQDKYLGLNWYNEIYLEQALEFCDMIFKNNFDKVYFLRQYLKSFEIGKENFEKAKTFIKK